MPLSVVQNHANMHQLLQPYRNNCRKDFLTLDNSVMISLFVSIYRIICFSSPGFPLFSQTLVLLPKPILLEWPPEILCLPFRNNFLTQEQIFTWLSMDLWLLCVLDRLHFNQSRLATQRIVLIQWDTLTQPTVPSDRPLTAGPRLLWRREAEQLLQLWLSLSAKLLPRLFIKL